MAMAKTVASQWGKLDWMERLRALVLPPWPVGFLVGHLH